MDIVCAIKHYCQNKNFKQSAILLGENDEESKKELKEMFEKYFNPESTKASIPANLSFSFKTSTNAILQRKRLGNMDLKIEQRKRKLNQEDKVKLKETKIPDEFLLLLDELGLDKKDARKFYENKDQWTYVKSDRKIFCTVKGKFEIKVLASLSSIEFLL